MGGNSFLRSVLTIAVPVGLQSMLQSSFAMIDQVMAGQLGSTAVAAIEAAGRPFFIYSVVVAAVSSTAGIMISQYLGMEEQALADRSLWVNLTAAAGLGAAFTLLCLLFPTQLVSLFLKDSPDILAAGREYLVYISWTYLPLGLASVLSAMLRCRDRASWTLAAGFLSALVNTALNYVLIFGHFGFPALGVTGAAIASVISQLVNFLLILLLFLRIHPSLRVSLDLGPAGYRQFLAMLLPLAANEFLWSLGQSLNTFIYGHTGGGNLAAISMTNPVQGLFIGALGGVAQAAGILIGKRLGAGEYEAAYRESRQLLRYGFIGSLVLSALLLLLRGPYTLLYRVEPEVRAASSALLAAFAVLAPVKVSNMILGNGILRSGGRTGYLVAIDLTGTWLVGAPLGLVTAFVFRLPIVWVYFILSQEEVVRLVLGWLVFRRRGWMRSLQK